MIQDPTEPNLIFVGTENGLWASVDNGNSYEQWKNGYPSVSTYDLAIQEREADLVIEGQPDLHLLRQAGLAALVPVLLTARGLIVFHPEEATGRGIHPAPA